MKNVIASGLLLFLACSTSARAQTMAVSVDPDRTAGASPYVQVFDVVLSAPFDVVVWLDSAGSDGQFAEFVVTDLQELVPGLFKLGTVTIGDSLDLGWSWQPGEFKLIYGECIPVDSQLELARISYADFAGVLGADFVMTVGVSARVTARPRSSAVCRVSWIATTSRFIARWEALRVA